MTFRKLPCVWGSSGSLLNLASQDTGCVRLVELSKYLPVARIDGVATVNVNGSLQRELSVLLHAQKLESLAKEYATAHKIEASGMEE